MTTRQQRRAGERSTSKISNSSPSPLLLEGVSILKGLDPFRLKAAVEMLYALDAHTPADVAAGTFRDTEEPLKAD
jgi:hypothetical protein